jgi:hypothetical protein
LEAVASAAANGRASAISGAQDAPALRPPLKWAGGKRWLVPRLRELYEPYRDRRLVEPLCGGLAVALGLHPRRALLNDISPHACNFYRRLSAGFCIDLAMRNDERLYYRYRAHFNRLVADGATESAEAAALFYFLNRTGYNGLCRFNSRGEFNVPFGRYATTSLTIAKRSRAGLSPTRTLPACASPRVISSTPTRPMMWYSRAMRRRISAGTIRSGWPNFSRAIADR